MTPTLKPGHYYGKILKAAETPALTLSEVSYSSGLKTPKHFHELAVLVISLEDAFTVPGCQSRRC